MYYHLNCFPSKYLFYTCMNCITYRYCIQYDVHYMYYKCIPCAGSASYLFIVMCYKCIVLHALLKVLLSHIELYMHDSALHAPIVHLTFFISSINCIIGIVCSITCIIYYHAFVLYAICIMCIVCTISALLCIICTTTISANS